MAGIFNWAVAIPPDVLKSRFQTGVSLAFLTKPHFWCKYCVICISYQVGVNSVNSRSKLKLQFHFYIFLIENHCGKMEAELEIQFTS